MENIFKENFKFIKNTFGSNDDNLKFTIKIINGKYVTDIFRGYDINNSFYEYEYINNTAFDEIMNNNKKYFYADNLEDLYKIGKYKNPRIKNKSEEWKECWSGYDNDDKTDNYYNSTLVIPMSITSDDEDKESSFFKAFFEETDKDIPTRTIWGFICFDSKKTDYFKNLNLENSNFIDLGYIISDILSIYLVYFYNYTITSNTIIEYEESLK